MSDLIEELVLDGCAFVACPRPQDCDTCPLTQLATIVREAEAEVKRSHDAVLALTFDMCDFCLRWKDDPIHEEADHE